MKTLRIIAVMAAVALFAATAKSQEPNYPGDCALGNDYAKFLMDHGYRPLGFGLVNERLTLELYVAKGGKWAVLTTQIIRGKSERSCQIARGSDWATFLPVMGGGI